MASGKQDIQTRYDTKKSEFLALTNDVIKLKIQANCGILFDSIATKLNIELLQQGLCQ